MKGRDVSLSEAIVQACGALEERLLGAGHLSRAACALASTGASTKSGPSRVQANRAAQAAADAFGDGVPNYLIECALDELWRGPEGWMCC